MGKSTVVEEFAKNEYESITGITYSSSNADVATVNEASGEITLVACGQTTIKAAYAGDDTYASSSATYTLRVVDNSIAAGEYTIPLNHFFIFCI